LDDETIISSEWTVLQALTAPAHKNFIELESRHPSATHAFNFKKNRYANVLPSEEYRVKLKNRIDIMNFSLGEVTNEIKTDFINASRITEGGSVYIAAMAPMDSTMDDFWQMIWDEEINTIVMILRLKEDGKVKGDRYWPESIGNTFETEQFEIFYEKIIDQSNLTIISEFSIRLKLDPNNVRNLFHLHYEGWPDFGVPDETSSIRELVNTMNRTRIGNSPILVHCSAGIGRTGTFLGIAIGMECLKEISEFEENEPNNPSISTSITKHGINIKDIILGLRRCRNRGMVQNQAQYKFIHEVLADEKRSLLPQIIKN